MNYCDKVVLENNTSWADQMDIELANTQADNMNIILVLVTLL